MKKGYEITAQGETAKIKITGDISGWMNSSDGFDWQLEEHKRNGVRNLDIYINSGGGDVFEANEIANKMDAFEGTITVSIGAICASAATLIAMKGKTIVMAKNGQFMIHNPQGKFSGDEKQIEAKLTLIKSIRNNMADDYAKVTGIDKDEILKMMDAETWMDAETAKTKGFIHSIIGEDTLTAQVDFAKYNYKHAPQIENQSQGLTTKTDMNKFKITAALNLSSEATEEEIVAALNKAVHEGDNAKKELATLKANQAKELATALVDGAIQAKKIAEGEKENYVVLATANYEATKKVLDGMKPVVQLSQINNQAGTGTSNQGVNADRSNWSWKDYTEKDEKALLAMRTENPEGYKALFKAHYKRECVID